MSGSLPAGLPVAVDTRAASQWYPVGLPAVTTLACQHNTSVPGSRKVVLLSAACCGCDGFVCNTNVLCLLCVVQVACT